MSTTPHMYFLLVLALAIIGLALRLFLKYQKSPSITYFASMFLGLAVLAAVTASILGSTDDGTLLFLTRLGYYAGTIVFSMMLMFSWYYPVPSKNIPRHTELFWILPMVFFLPFFLMGPMAIQSIEQSGGLVKEVTGSSFFIFPLFVAVYFLWSLWNLIPKRATVQGEQKRNLELVTTGLTLGAAASIIFDALLPLFGQPPRHYISIELSSVLIGVTAYIATRK